MRHDANVIVVGAGVAGLAAARALSQSGRKVLVLEARSRIGAIASGQRAARFVMNA